MKGSNSTIGVMLVAAGLGFAGHHYLLRNGAGTLPFLGPLDAGVTAVEPDPAEQRLQSASEELLQMTLESDQRLPDQKVQTLMEQLDQAYTELARDLADDTEEAKALRASTLYAKYAAARFSPATYGRTFWDFAETLKRAGPENPEAANAALLQVLVKTDFQRPSLETIQRDLKEFTDIYPAKQGAALYCLVAEELVTANRNLAAEKILRQGIANYDSSPVAGMLVNQLVDLGFTKTQPGENRGRTYSRVMRAMQARAMAKARNAAPARPSPRPS
jgi:hypothetical protein